MIECELTGMIHAPIATRGVTTTSHVDMDVNRDFGSHHDLINDEPYKQA